MHISIYPLNKYIKEREQTSFVISPHVLYRRSRFPLIDRTKKLLNFSNAFASKQSLSKKIPKSEERNKSKWIHSFTNGKTILERYEHLENKALSKLNLEDDKSDKRKMIQVSIKITNCPLIITDKHLCTRTLRNSQCYHKFHAKRILLHREDKQFQTDYLKRNITVLNNR